MNSFIEFEDILLATSGVSVAIAVVVSVVVIILHQRNFTQPNIQSKTVGILWMIPIYSICSFISLVIPNISLYIDLLRDCYESYVLYLFLALMLAYLTSNGGYDFSQSEEYEIIKFLENLTTRYHPFPMKIFFRQPLPKGRSFLKQSKFGVMQYCLVKPLTTATAIILDLAGLYGESDFNPRQGFLYVTIAANLSVAYAFYTLAMFYHCLKELLKPHDPVPKFLCIKGVLFFSFWQGVLISLAVKAHLIHDIGPYSASTVASQLKNFLSCVEMLAFSIVYAHAFSYKSFAGRIISYEATDMYTALGADLEEAETGFRLRPNSTKQTGATNLGLLPSSAPFLSISVDLDRHFAHKTAIRDFNDAMPVVLPSSFSPKRGISIPSNPSDRVKFGVLTDMGSSSCPEYSQLVSSYQPPEDLSASQDKSETSALTHSQLQRVGEGGPSQQPTFTMNDGFDF